MATPKASQKQDMGARALRTVDVQTRRTHDPHMETRIQQLEHHALDARERLTRIETTLGHTATTQALAELETRVISAMGDLKSDLVRWFITVGLTLAALAFTAGKFVH